MIFHYCPGEVLLVTILEGNLTIYGGRMGGVYNRVNVNACLLVIWQVLTPNIRNVADIEFFPAFAPARGGQVSFTHSHTKLSHALSLADGLGGVRLYVCEGGAAYGPCCCELLLQ